MLLAWLPCGSFDADDLMVVVEQVPGKIGT